MQNRFAKLLVEVLCWLLAAVAAFYLGCMIYRLATHLVYYVATMTMILLHIFGIHSVLIQAPSVLAERVRGWNAGMYALGVSLIALCLFLLARLRRRAPQRSIPWVIGPVALIIVAFAALLDYRYAITPLSETAFLEVLSNHTAPQPQAHFTVSEIMYLRDSQAGAITQTEGLLRYSQVMGRFGLEETDSATTGRHSINLFFFKGRRTGLSEMRHEGKPRFYAQVSPLIGRRVRITGRCYNGYLEADVADLQALQ